ncbi:MAG: response regulator [Polyangiales bacterium]
MPSALVVDDLAQNRYMLEALLRGHGYQVTSVANGAEALEAARRKKPDLVISDILMPVMDGFALCRTWKSDVQLKSVPFVFYTATYTDPKDERLAMSLGADAFILKPIEPDAFVGAIEALLDKHRQHEIEGRPPEVSSEAFLKEHNDALFRKLEHKVAQLEAEILERKRVEHALRESEEHFRRVVQESPMPIAVVGERGEVLHLNAQFTHVFGYTLTDVPDLAAWWSRAYPDERVRRDLERAWRDEIVAALRDGREVEPEEIVIAGKDGVLHTVERHVAPIGKTALVLFNDISERRRLELLRDQFLAAAAHELKTPVTTIKGYSQLLLRWAPLEDRPARERVAIAAIDAQCDRIQQRVDEMMAAARCRTGLASARAERIDLCQLASDVVRRLQATTDAHRVLFERPARLLVDADPEHLDEALATLLDRMLRAVPAGEDVRVRLWAEGKEARLSITGRGRLVPKDQEALYFEPLFDFRPSGGARDLPATVELGPYLAKLAVERQGGRIWLESERDGSVFVIALPRVEE